MLFQEAVPAIGRNPDQIRLTERHFISRLVPTETWSKPQARCRVCSKNGRRRDVKTCCLSCPSKPGLCPYPCFRLWHTRQVHWEPREM